MPEWTAAVVRSWKMGCGKEWSGSECGLSLRGLWRRGRVATGTGIAAGMTAGVAAVAPGLRTLIPRMNDAMDRTNANPII